MKQQFYRIVGFILVCSILLVAEIRAWAQACPVDSVVDGYGLVLDNTYVGDGLGSTVANVGDVNQDGYEDYAVKAVRDLINGEIKNNVRIYSGKTGERLGTIYKPSANPYMKFGDTIVRLDDLNGDGIDEILISMFSDMFLAGSPGQLIAYDPTTLLPIKAYKAPQEVIDSFGYSAHSIGDLDGDGTKDILVATEKVPLENDSCEVCQQRGVYVISGKTGAIINTLLPPEEDIQLFFGSSLTDMGDVNGDGFEDIAIGSYAVGGNGRVYLYSGKDLMSVSNPMPSLTIYSPDVEKYKFFGYSIDNMGDINGDGINDLLISALVEYSDFTDGGFVGIYSVHNWVEGILLSATLPQSKSWLNVKAIPDITGDGRMDIAIYDGDYPHGQVLLLSSLNGLVKRVFAGSSLNVTFGVAMDYTLNPKGRYKLIIGDPKDTAGMDYTGSSFSTGTDMIAAESGGVYSLWISPDTNNNGEMDVCEEISQEETTGEGEADSGEGESGDNNSSKDNSSESSDSEVQSKLSEGKAKLAAISAKVKKAFKLRPSKKEIKKAKGAIKSKKKKKAKQIKKARKLLKTTVNKIVSSLSGVPSAQALGAFSVGNLNKLLQLIEDSTSKKITKKEAKNRLKSAKKLFYQMIG